MKPESANPEYPYAVKIETSNGESSYVPIAFLTRQQVETLIQSDFKRLVQEAGMQGAKVVVEHAETANYNTVLNEISACLRTAKVKAA